MSEQRYDAQILAGKVFAIAICGLAILTTLYIAIVGMPDVVDSLSGRVVFRMARRHSRSELLVLRDILPVLSYIVLLFMLALSSARVPRLPLFACICALVSCSVVVAAINLSPIVAFLGLRTYLYVPTIMVFFVCAYYWPAFQNRFASCLLVLVVFEFIISALQTRLMQPFEGSTFFGSRVIGSFNNPNTIGNFAALMVFYFLFLVPGILRRWRIVLVGISVLTILMSGSRGAIIASSVMCGAFAIYHTRRELRACLIFSACFAVVALFNSFAVLSGRGRDAANIIADPRWSIFYQAIQDMTFVQFLFGQGSGVRSNLVIFLNQIFSDRIGLGDGGLVARVAESTHLAMVSQIGFVGFSIFLLLLLLISLRGGVAGIALFAFVVILGLSNVWLEMYPLNFLIFAFYGIMLANAQRHRDSQVKSLKPA